MPPSFAVTITGQDGTVTHIVDRELTIGRGDCDIVLSDGGVSRRHASIAPGDGWCVVTDLGSSNGTFVKVKGERGVGDDSYVLLGQQLFRLQLA